MAKLTYRDGNAAPPSIGVLVVAAIAALAWIMVVAWGSWLAKIQPLDDDFCTCELGVYDYLAAHKLIDPKEVEKIQSTEKEIAGLKREMEPTSWAVESRGYDMRTGEFTTTYVRDQRVLARLQEELSTQEYFLRRDKRKLASEVGRSLVMPTEQDFSSLWNKRQIAKAKFDRIGGNSLLHKLAPLCPCIVLCIAIVASGMVLVSILEYFHL